MSRLRARVGPGRLRKGRPWRCRLLGHVWGNWTATDERRIAFYRACRRVGCVGYEVQWPENK